MAAVRWYAISGSWRQTDAAVQGDVEVAVISLYAAGNGVVTGGALGVDFIATAAALELDFSTNRLKIILPTPLAVYAAHYRKRAGEGVITPLQAEDLITQLTEVQDRNPLALIEMAHAVCTEETYFDRNTKVIETADELLAFQVNGSQGVQDAIDKAIALGKPVHIKR